MLTAHLLRDLECGKNMETYMRNAGLEVVERRAYKWPYGTWLAKEGHPESLRLGDSTIRTLDMFQGMMYVISELLFSHCSNC